MNGLASTLPAVSDELRLAAELAFWLVPTALGARLVARARGRRTWILILAVTVLILLDKLFDLQIEIYELGRAFVRRFEPDDPKRIAAEPALRYALLAAAFAGLALTVVAWVRPDRDLFPAKALSLFGLLCLGAYLGLRIAPQFKVHFEGRAQRAAEVLCWALIVAGQVLELRAEHARERRRS